MKKEIVLLTPIAICIVVAVIIIALYNHLIVIEFIPFEARESSVPYGIEAIFISLGFLIYYSIKKKQLS